MFIAEASFPPPPPPYVLLSFFLFPLRWKFDQRWSHILFFFLLAFFSTCSAGASRRFRAYCSSIWWIPPVCLGFDDWSTGVPQFQRSKADGDRLATGSVPCWKGWRGKFYTKTMRNSWVHNLLTFRHRDTSSSRTYFIGAWLHHCLRQWDCDLDHDPTTAYYSRTHEPYPVLLLTGGCGNLIRLYCFSLWHLTNTALIAKLTRRAVAHPRHRRPFF